MEARPLFFLQICLFSCTFLLFIGSVTGTDSVFQGEVVGHLDFMCDIGVPIPPNYTGTISPGDIPSFRQVVFRLHYNGEIPTELTKLEITQVITSYGQTWNYTRVIIDLSPSITLLSGNSHAFLINGSSNTNFIDDGLFYVKITTVNMGIFWTSFSSQGLFHSLPTWPLPTSSRFTSTTTELATITTSSSLRWQFLLLLCTSFVLLKRRNKSKDH
ncbi:MAG: hypothetical protein ACFFB2_11160 [Promethearchaeota archaeon]